MIAGVQAVSDGVVVSATSNPAVSESEFDSLLAWLDWLSSAWVAAALATAVAWIVWQYRAHMNLRVLNTPNLSFRSGWAVAWWIVPIAFLFQPYRAMREVLKASMSSSETWKELKTPISFKWWWALWISGGILNSAIAQVESIDWYLALSILRAAVIVGAAVLALHLIGQITRAQVSRLGIAGARSRYSSFAMRALPWAVAALLVPTTAWGTSRNLTPGIGPLYDQREYDDAQDASHDEGYDRGLIQGTNIGFSDGRRSGLDAGYAQGAEDGYEFGYDDGFSDGEDEGHYQGYIEGWDEGCLFLFNNLNTDRVGSWWDYYYSPAYASYYEIGVCAWEP
ncbi:MAG TPA: DUF4328 domain-containing protein [Acidimicrobiia bacterium]|nr:DUF4328 domain-containing protein [Acidimicrobiia bacterium]